MTVPTPLRGSNGITFGPDGRLYVAEFLPGRISSVDVATGAVQTVIAPDGPLQAPDDVAFGADGTMYITDLSPGQVWRLGLDGDLTVLAGDLANPNGIAVLGDRVFVNEMTFGGRLLEVTDGVPRVLTEGLTLGNAMQFGPDGNLYYPHMFPGDVYRIAPDGGVPELVAADVPQTVAVRLDRNGVLHVLLIDEAGTIVRIEDGERTTIVTGIPGLDNAAFDADNRMFVSSFAAGGITEVLPGGGTREVVPRGLAGPFDVTVDAGGAVVTADHYRIDGALRPFAHAIAADGDVLHFTSQYGQAGTFDRTSRSARARAENLEQPRGIAVRPDGALIVAEAGRGRVLAISPADEVSVLAEGLGRPAGIAVDADGRVHVTDEEHGAVYRLDDGKPVALAEGLDTPQGLAFSGGRLFAAEAGRRRVVEVGSPVRVVAAELPIPLPRPITPNLFGHGLPGVPQPFAGLAAGPDGALYLAAAGEGTVGRITV
ncbi:hypothetical protein [Actinoplanes utahensis]|uniref:Vgb family protein n=1 Tax=Actinoplanes utahensis TaxID=1869 RepID=UPI0019504681|nr:hypothetical protein [Actinoplanes utahensis]GIF30777.1 hypothetical protein Aut01nite_37630 [Actinoplanes utahensis]